MTKNGKLSIQSGVSGNESAVKIAAERQRKKASMTSIDFASVSGGGGRMKRNDSKNLDLTHTQLPTPNPLPPPPHHYRSHLQRKNSQNGLRDSSDEKGLLEVDY